MNTYVALLRGINVGGRKLIKMDQLLQIFTAAGCRNVRTFIQTGNVIFESSSKDTKALTRKIERALEAKLGYSVTVILKQLSQLESIVKRNPFKKFAAETEAVPFVVFFNGEPDSQLKLPLKWPAENLEVFEIKDGAALVVARRKQNGRFDFPNAVLEKNFGVSATTRNWNTVQKIVAAALQNREQ